MLHFTFQILENWLLKFVLELQYDQILQKYAKLQHEGITFMSGVNRHMSSLGSF